MVHRGGLLLSGFSLSGTAPRTLFAADEGRRPRLKFGVVTDIHYADKEPTPTRFYRESLKKLSADLDFLEPHRPDFIVELGDLIDKSDDIDQQIEFLKRIEEVYAKATCDRHYVLGNHCVETLTKSEFIENCGATAAHYSFDKGGVHFVVLDACFRSDGVSYGRNNHDWKDTKIPAEQMEWLRQDLERSGKPTIVFAHQRLDGEGAHWVENAAAVRGILAEAGQVLAVLQGHSHKNDYRRLDGIHFCTMVAVVEGSGTENNGGALVSLFDDGSIRIEGFFRQSSYDFGGNSPASLSK
ncbi:MAG: metallophosphoesterase [Verrucomicrobiae bacterium]|nr:metallophosphoesterase [Verrucomicrobiae bacterium]MCB1085408.1 metallophosphoesterase [Verrucomicrobiae bacterium]MCB1089962.1 metallophosphoesterase [Verrucomicrobiae bacterium]